jgi:hypothetical protein
MPDILTPEELYVAIESIDPDRAVAMIAARDVDIRAEAVRECRNVVEALEGTTDYGYVVMRCATALNTLLPPPAAERSDADG